MGKLGATKKEIESAVMNVDDEDEATAVHTDLSWMND